MNTPTSQNRRVRKVAALAAGIALIGGLSACSEGSQANSQTEGQKQTEQAFEQQTAAVPYPVGELRDSLERRNLRERLLRQNQTDRIGYVYITSMTGEFIGYYVIQGKVSSTQSQMTTEDLIQYACDDGMSGCQAVTVGAPGDDGSYGPNEDGVFFFTTQGAMVQTALPYIYSDTPIPVGNVPELNGEEKVDNVG